MRLTDVAKELNPQFFDAWIDSLRSGWGRCLGMEEDLYFWMFIAGGRDLV